MTIASHEPNQPHSTSLKPRRHQQAGKSSLALQKQQQVENDNNDNDSDDKENDDDMTKLALDIDFSSLPISFSPYSSIHSDLKESGSIVLENQPIPSNITASSKFPSSTQSSTDDRLGGGDRLASPK